MNWYKKIIFSTRNLKFPEKIEEQIDEATHAAVNYYFSNNQEKTYQGSFTYVNPYGKKDKPIPILTHPYTIENINEIANFNPQHRLINVFPYHHNLRDVNPTSLFNYLKPFIYHEFAHAVDPKFLIPEWWRGRENIPYYEKEEEFDAYSKQMELIIQSNLNKDNTNEFKKWITSTDILSMPQYLNYFYNIIENWRTYKPEYIKLLRQRLYNSFIRSKEDVVPKENKKRPL